MDSQQFCSMDEERQNQMPKAFWQWQAVQYLWDIAWLHITSLAHWYLLTDQCYRPVQEANAHTAAWSHWPVVYSIHNITTYLFFVFQYEILSTRTFHYLLFVYLIKNNFHLRRKMLFFFFFERGLESVQPHW